MLRGICLFMEYLSRLFHGPSVFSVGVNGDFLAFYYTIFRSDS